MNPESEERPYSPAEWAELYLTPRTELEVAFAKAKRADPFVLAGLFVLVVAAGVGAVLAMIGLV